MDTRDADIVDAIDIAADEIRRHGRLFRHGKIGGASAKESDAGGARPWLAVEHNSAGVRPEFGIWQDLADGRKRFRVGASDEETVVARREAQRNPGNLLRRLSESENDLRESVTKGAMMVDPGIAQVFVGQVAQALESLVDTEVLLPNRREEVAKSVLVDRTRSSAEFDLGPAGLMPARPDYNRSARRA
jgi:hypothetical protein